MSGLLTLLTVIGVIIYTVVTAASRTGRLGHPGLVTLYNHAASANHSDRDLRCIQIVTLPGGPFQTVTVPRVDVCVYSAEEDRYVSAQLIKEGIWEPRFLTVFQKALRNYPTSEVIDLGAHIGFHTLLAAGLGHRVLAVEPVTSSLRRIHHAALLSGLRKNITLFHNAIYNTRTYAWLRQPPGNIGGTTIVIPKTMEGSNKQNAVRTILTDDLFPFISQRIVVIKMDIEGCECRAISSATLLFSGKHIPYIFIDWSAMFLRKRKPGTACAIENIERMTIFLAHRGFVPYEVQTNKQLNWRQSATWHVGYVYWRHVSADDLRDGPVTTPAPPDDVDDEDYGDRPW